jgi:hypothetical protein
MSKSVCKWDGSPKTVDTTSVTAQVGGLIGEQGMRERTRWWVEILRMPVVVVHAIVAPLYRICFGWLDRRLARKNEQRLAQEVRSAFGFLFGEEQAQIILNEGVRFPLSLTGNGCKGVSPRIALNKRLPDRNSGRRA